jgi:phthalate 4,5-dioxygenase oxygenase subunit
VDDTHHNIFWGAWPTAGDFPADDGLPEQLQWAMGELPYDAHDLGRFSGGRDENFGQDRAAMKAGHFTGMTGNLLQEDLVTQASMGPIVDRTLDHLSSSDVAIVHARKLMLDAVADFTAGRTPRASGPGLDFRDVVPLDAVLPAGQPDRTREPAVP